MIPESKMIGGAVLIFFWFFCIWISRLDGKISKLKESIKQLEMKFERMENDGK